MPAFRYIGEEPRIYPTVAGLIQPGDEHDIDVDPGDGRWEPVKKKPTQTAAAVVAEPKE